MATRFRWMSVFLTAAVLAAATPAFAQPPRPGPHGSGPNTTNLMDQSRDDQPQGRARISVMVVYANHSDQVDPRAANLKRQLGSMGFTGFQVLSTHDSQLTDRQNASFNVEGGRKVTVTLVSRDEEEARVRIQWTRNEAKIVDTTVAIHRDRAFTMGGPNYQDGKMVLVVNVNY